MTYTLNDDEIKTVAICLNYAIHRALKHNKMKQVGSLTRINDLKDKLHLIRLPNFGYEKYKYSIDFTDKKAEKNAQLTYNAIWSYKQCKHYGSWFKHWFKNYFHCSACGGIFTKKQIEYYRKFNKIYK